MNLLENNLTYNDIEKEIRYHGIKINMFDYCSLAVYFSENKVEKQTEKQKLWIALFKNHHDYCMKNRITDTIPIIISRKDFLFLFEDFKSKNKKYSWDKILDMSFRSNIEILSSIPAENIATTSLKLGENLKRKFLISKFDLERKLIEINYFSKQKKKLINQKTMIEEVLNIQNFEKINGIEHTELYGIDIKYIFNQSDDTCYPALLDDIIEPLQHCYYEELQNKPKEKDCEIKRIFQKFFGE